MAGMEQLGRNVNVVAVASGVGIRIADCSSIAWLMTYDGSTAFHATLSISPTFTGSYVNSSISWNPIVHYYTNADNGAGTGQWSAAVANNSAGNAYNGQGAGSYLVPYTGSFTAGNAAWVELLASQVPAGYEYVKCTVSGGSGLCIAIAQLDVQRRPANLPAMSA